MKSKHILLCLFSVLSLSSKGYGLTCEQLYQNHSFKRVVVSVMIGDVRCHYHGGSRTEELTYYIGNDLLDSYMPTYGNWRVTVPRFWECSAKHSSECGFEKS